MPEDEPQGKVFSNELQNPFEQEGACQRMIDYLYNYQLGRIMVREQIRSRKNNNPLQASEILPALIAKQEGISIDRSEQVREYIPLGAILPIAENSDQYLVMLANNNDILILQLPSPANCDEKTIQGHRLMLEPSAAPIIYTSKLPEIAYQVRRGWIFGQNIYKVIADSSRPKDKDIILAKMQESFDYTQKLHQQNELARAEVAQQGLEIFGKTFPDFNPPPPPELPTTPTE